MFRKHRLEALSDGIFAIAMTLLVLEFKIPEHVVPGHLWEALADQRIAFLCYALTFAITARYWILQHAVFELVEQVHKPALVLTFVFLALIALLPFTTPLMARYGTDRAALAIYCVNQAGIGAALTAKLEVLRVKDRLPKSSMLTGLRLKLWTLSSAMAIGAAMAFLLPARFAFWPSVAVIFVGQRLANRYKTTTNAP